MRIIQFLDGIAEWDGECGDAEESEVQAALRQDPKRCWRLAIEPDRKTRLKDLVSRSKLDGWLRSGMRESISRRYESGSPAWARSVLLVEGTLSQQEGRYLVLGLSEAQRSQWARQWLDEVPDGREIDPLPVEILKPWTEWRINLDAERTTGNAGLVLRTAFGIAVRAAVADLLRTEDVPSETLARLAVLRIQALVDEDSEDQKEPSELARLVRIGSERERLAEWRDAFSEGPQAVVRQLHSLGDAGQTPMDWDKLHRHARYRSMCETLGFNCQPPFPSLQYRGTDPWVATVLKGIRGADPRFASLRDRTLALPDADRTRRDRCLELLAHSHAVAFEDAVDKASADLAGSLPSGTAGVSRQERAFHVELIPRLIGARIALEQEPFRRRIHELGGDPLVRWADDSWRDFLQAARSAVDLTFDDDFILGLRSEAFAKDPWFKPLASRLESLRVEVGRGRAEGELRERGRVWLYELVRTLHESGGKLPPDRNILEDADRTRLVGWIDDFDRSGPSDLRWAVEPELHTVEEMRLRGYVQLVRKVPDPELPLLADAVRASILDGLDAAEQEHAERRLDDCVRWIVTGKGNLPTPVLFAFRRADPHEFKFLQSGENIPLGAPPLISPSGGRASVALLAGCLVFLAILCVEPIGAAFSRGGSAPQAAASGKLEPGWIEIEEGKGKFARVLHLEDLDRLFPARECIDGLFDRDERPLRVDPRLANEWIGRFATQQQFIHCEGIPGIGSWKETGEIRLPSTFEEGVVKEKLGLKQAPILTSGERSTEERGVCIAVINKK
jgi:hypothetical protein